MMRYMKYMVAAMMLASPAMAFDIGGMILQGVKTQVQEEIKNEAKAQAKEVAKEAAKEVAKQQGIEGADKAIDFAVDNADGIQNTANNLSNVANSNVLTDSGKAFVGANLAVGAVVESTKEKSAQEPMEALKNASPAELAMACKGDATCIRNAQAAVALSNTGDTLGGSLVKGAKGFLTGVMTKDSSSEIAPAAGQ